MANRGNKAKTKRGIEIELSFDRGCLLVSHHPIFSRLYRGCIIQRVRPDQYCGPGSDGLALIEFNGESEPVIRCNSSVLVSTYEWAYVISHCLLHLGFGHFNGPSDDKWNIACDITVAKFLRDIRFGNPPPGIGSIDFNLPLGEERLYEWLLSQEDIESALLSAGVCGYKPDMIGRAQSRSQSSIKTKSSPISGLYRRVNLDLDFPKKLGIGLAESVSAALEVVTERRDSVESTKPGIKTEAMIAREWFIASFPLLGALAASFKLNEDPNLCRILQIQVAAVDSIQQVIYIHPAAGLSQDELRFVIAHELLHVGLRHSERSEGRDPFIWNVACDYVINHWLVEMHVGQMPKIGVAIDPKIASMSAEQIYDQIVRDLRAIRKISSLRGVGIGDMLEPDPRFWGSHDGMKLDEFYRSALAQGLEYQESTGRGLLPAGLVQEIRALMLPPIPWEVQLARWFDVNFPPIEKRRTYARFSRRQSTTPDIPRPAYYYPEELRDGRTFAVLLDTSGSMSAHILGQALGAIASYAQAKDVLAVRLVFCDAAPYDQGYVSPEEISGRVEVKGRGGSVLQGAINLIETAKDFPKDGPILVITDGQIDENLSIQRKHGFLMPIGARLPFRPIGDTFFIKDK